VQREKEKAIRHRFSTRMAGALKCLAQRMEQGQLKDRQKIGRQLGRIQARRRPLADLYRMRVIEREGERRPNQNSWESAKSARAPTCFAPIWRANLLKKFEPNTSSSPKPRAEERIVDPTPVSHQHTLNYGSSFQNPLSGFLSG
jgi:hypothetical protein